MNVAGSLWADVRVLSIESPGGIASRSADLARSLGAEVSSLRAVDAASLHDLASNGGEPQVVLIDHRFGDDHLGEVPEATLDAWIRAHRVVCVFSPYGLTGPLAADIGSELTVQARAGILATNGFADDPPLTAGVPVATCAASLLGVTAIAAALRRRRRTGHGELIDLAAFDAVLALLGTLLPTLLLEGKNPVRVGNRHLMTAPWNTYRTADGWVVLTVMGQTMWSSFAAMLGVPELAADERFFDAMHRVANVEALDELVTAWTCQRTTEEVLAEASSAGIPAAPIQSVREALEEFQGARPELIRCDGDQVRAGLPFTVDLTGAETTRRQRVPQQGDDRPLAGVRVLEVGAFTSGPLAGRLVGMLGADVLKVEPPNGENSRILAQQIGGCGYLYHLNNTDKRGCVLDLRDPRDAERLRRLAEDADVLLTNLATGTLERLGVGYDDLAARAPQLIYCAVTGFGLATPRSRDKAFDTMIQALSGIMSLTGFPSGPPTKIAISFVDLLGAYAAAGAVTAALYAREEDGRGSLVNVPMMDTAVWATQDEWTDVLMRGADPHRRGNARRKRALHDVFATSDGRIAIDVSDAGELRRLLDTLDIPLGDRSDASAAVARRVATEQTEALVQRLQGARVRAGEVLDLARLIAHPQVAERRLLRSFDLNDDLTVQVIGTPFRFRDAVVDVHRPAPALGADPPAWDGHDREVTPP